MEHALNARNCLKCRVPEKKEFHAMRNAPFYGMYDGADRPSDAELIKDDVLPRILEERLPATWNVRTMAPPNSQGDIDLVLELAPPNGAATLIAVEVKSRLDPGMARNAIQRLRSMGQLEAIILAPFVPKASQRLIREAGFGYADPLGNIFITLDDPPVFIYDQGESMDPWRVTRPIYSLKGRAANRVVRGLCDFIPPYPIRELAKRTQTPLSSVSRVVAYAERQALVRRSDRGGVLEVDWAALIRAWSLDYAVLRSNFPASFIDPRGPAALEKRLETLDRVGIRYAVTASAAASRIAPFAPRMTSVVFVENRAKARDALGLVPTTHGANVWLVRPADPVVFDRTIDVDGVTLAAPSQVAADLLSMGERAPQEAEELIRWMGANESVWRR
jgi:hypothetical protein